MHDLETLERLNNERVQDMALARRLAWQEHLRELNRRALAWCHEQTKARAEQSAGY